MEELQPQEIEDLLQELEEEYSAEEVLAPEVETKVRVCPECGKHNLENAWHCIDCGTTLSMKTLMDVEGSQPKVATPESEGVKQGRGEASTEKLEDLLHFLEHGSSVRARVRVAERLGQADESRVEIVKALIAARDNDPFYTVRNAAAEALRAPVHQAVLQEDADPMRRAQQEATPRDWEAELLAPSLKPERLQVEAQGSTLCLSWKDGALHKVLSAGLTLFLLLVFAGSLFAGTFSRSGVCPLTAALLMSGYWLLVAFANSTRITASREEWIFERGPVPFPSRRFYSFGKTRIDPAAYREIRAVPVDEKRGGGGSSELAGAIAELLLEQFMEPRITYSLYAHAKNGTDKLLLARLEDREADYLEHTLQDLLDAGSGPQAGEGTDGLTAEPVDLEASVQEVSETTNLEALLKQRWFAVGIVASVGAYAAGVLVSGYLIQPWNPALLDLGSSVCFGMPGLALSLFVLSQVALRSTEAKRSVVVAIVVGSAILNLIIGLVVGIIIPFAGAIGA